MTTRGPMAAHELIKTSGVSDDASVSWVEYRLPGSDDIIHRSAHVDLKGDGMGLYQAVLASL